MVEHNLTRVCLNSILNMSVRSCLFLIRSRLDLLTSHLIQLTQVDSFSDSVRQLWGGEWDRYLDRSLGAERIHTFRGAHTFQAFKSLHRRLTDTPCPAKRCVYTRFNIAHAQAMAAAQLSQQQK